MFLLQTLFKSTMLVSFTDIFALQEIPTDSKKLKGLTKKITPKWLLR
jgi:hypothetical protein